MYISCMLSLFLPTFLPSLLYQLESNLCDLVVPSRLTSAFGPTIRQPAIDKHWATAKG